MRKEALLLVAAPLSAVALLLIVPSRSGAG